MLSTTDDLRIREIKALTTPAAVMGEHPRTLEATRTVTESRAAFHNILRGSDDRLAVVIGPCSIHDPVAALDYANRLMKLRQRLGSSLEIIMRVYFEKPRTTVGWKGLINDPDLDGSFQIDKGLRIARKVLLDINNLGLPAAVHRRPRRLGCDRRAHDRKPDPSRTRLGPELPRRLQEWHGRQCAHRGGRGEVGLAAASLHGRDEGRPVRHRFDHGQ
jgi:hypothetical protein